MRQGGPVPHRHPAPGRDAGSHPGRHAAAQRLHAAARAGAQDVGHRALPPRGARARTDAHDPGAFRRRISRACRARRLPGGCLRAPGRDAADRQRRMNRAASVE